MTGLFIGLIWIGIAAILGKNICQASISAANFLFYWYIGFTIFYMLLVGILFPAIGALAYKTKGAIWGSLAGIFSMVMVALSGGLFVTASWLYSSAAPANATDWSGFNQQKLILAGILVAIGLVSRMGTTVSSKTS